MDFLSMNLVKTLIAMAAVSASGTIPLTWIAYRTKQVPPASVRLTVVVLVLLTSALMYWLPNSPAGLFTYLTRDQNVLTLRMIW